jgi:hypothetical protein
VTYARPCRSRPRNFGRSRIIFCESVVADDNRWLSLNRFREATFFEISTDALLDLVLAQLNAEEKGSDRELFFYEACFGLAYSAELPHAETVFATLYDKPAGRADLLAVRDRAVSFLLLNGYLNRSSRRPEEEEHSVEKLRKNFERDADQIRNGALLGWIEHSANVYLHFSATSTRRRAHMNGCAPRLGRPIPKSPLPDSVRH